MSSRALRKLQKQRDEELQQQILDEEESEPQSASPAARSSAFALLGDEDADDDNDDDEEDDEHGDNEVVEAAKPGEIDSDKTDTPSPQQTSKRKKKKKAKKAKGRPNNNPSTDMDDIDAAIKALSTQDSKSRTAPYLQPAEPRTLRMCELLAIDSQHLQVSNEMRRLFGRAAFDAEREEAADFAARRAQAGEGGGYGIAEAIKGRNSQGGPGISQVILRRNLFVKGKDDWPKATANGLGMDVVQQHAGGITEFSFKHDKQYQSAQREFDACVLSMDPTLMIRMLLYYPYNISTLLQVSEIAKHEKDYSTSGELLERALFSFGRAVHSSFADAISKGKARLNFRRPENREFFLAAWRYIINIGMRATWRTAYEWAKMLLSLSPEEDPYCIRLVLDQFSLRAKQADHFLSVSTCDFFASRWSTLPNMAFSTGLAQKSQAQLVKAIEAHPWVAARLLSALDVTQMPPAVRGKSPPAGDDHSALLCEVYATQSLDLWKAPQARDLLLAACNATDAQRTASTSIGGITPITIDEARHVLLTDKPPLIALLPHEITSKVDSTSDPLPPADSLSTYTTDVAAATRHRQSGMSTDIDDALTSVPAQELMEEDPRAFIEELGVLQKFFDMLELEAPQHQQQQQQQRSRGSTFTPLISASTPSAEPTGRLPGSFPIDGDDNDDAEDGESEQHDLHVQNLPPAQQEVAQDLTGRLNVALSRSGATLSELRGRLQRFAELVIALRARPDSRLETDEGDFAAIDSDGHVECHLVGMEIVGELRNEQAPIMFAFLDELRRHAREVNDAQVLD